MASNTPERRNQPPGPRHPEPRDMGPDPRDAPSTRKPDPDRHPHGGPPGQDKPRADQGPAAPPAPSQKAQIIQYLKSQNVQPDQTIWSIGGLNLTLKDLEG
jgi:hypothetical protein